jgi:hypothetical protein
VAAARPASLATPNARVGQATFVPVRWLPGEAWALIDGAWQRVNDADVGNEARLLDTAAYESTFGASLIALPATAFQR